MGLPDFVFEACDMRLGRQVVAGGGIAKGVMQWSERRIHICRMPYCEHAAACSVLQGGSARALSSVGLSTLCQTLLGKPLGEFN